MEQIIIALLADDISRHIFKQIGDKRKISLKEIRNSVPPTESEHLTKKLEELRQANLVGVVNSQYADFNKYYLTADGQRTFKMLTNTLAATSR